MSLDITGIGALAEAATGLINHFFPDKTEQQKAELALEMQTKLNEFQLAKAQIDVNAVEAASTNWFVAGWRPAIGWICGAGLAYAVLVEPLMRFIATMVGYAGVFPAIDTSITMQILVGMLGLAGLRTVEKHQDVEKKR